MDDWGFSNGEDGGQGEGGAGVGDEEGRESDLFSFDSSAPHSHSHRPGHSGHTPGVHEVPAEDVAFWGEDLAEQLYLEDQQAQSMAPKSAAAEPAEPPAPTEQAAAPQRKRIRKPSAKSKNDDSSAFNDVESSTAKTQKVTLNKLMSLLGKVHAK